MKPIGVSAELRRNYPIAPCCASDQKRPPMPAPYEKQKGLELLAERDMSQYNILRPLTAISNFVIQQD